MAAEALSSLTLRSLDAIWNREMWEQLPDDGNRYEVIDGVLYMTTSPSNFHQWISRVVFVTLYQQIDTLGIGVTHYSPMGVFMPGCDPVQPDIFVVRSENMGIFRDRHVFGVPDLSIEILSPSNSIQDTQIKRGAYARAGVPEYWIVNPRRRDVLIYSAPQAGSYSQEQRFAEGEELVSPTLSVRAAVAEFFAGAPDTML
jgi:Uma2 family endonuclease